jgi:hypothetical protein
MKIYIRREWEQEDQSQWRYCAPILDCYGLGDGDSDEVRDAEEAEDEREEGSYRSGLVEVRYMGLDVELADRTR